ncbi:MAG: hypothetical protein IRZ10_08280 [Thermoflavifilum sp.]|nr:hypothetical protein [Thermoflavifilum sp.]MCL6514408.1 endolytic transglycosylase MltG [Alicyclobacillus sp.]
MTAKNRVNPLLTSVVHRPLRKACQELGFPLPNREQFVADVDPLLKDTPGLAAHPEGLAERLWHAVLGGEVLAAEWHEDGRMVFHVRGQHGRDAVDVRLMHDRDHWQVQALTSVHTRPWHTTRWARRLAAGAAVVVALVIGYILPHPGSGEKGLPAGETATTAGAVPAGNTAVGEVNTLASRSEATRPASNAVAANQTGSGGNQAGSNASGAGAAATPPAKPAVQTFTFNLQEGMPLHNLSVFLYQHHLVSDPVAFDMKMKDSGVDRDVRPGQYVFKSNMTEAQILQVLKNGPSS